MVNICAQHIVQIAHLRSESGLGWKRRRGRGRWRWRYTGHCAYRKRVSWRRLRINVRTIACVAHFVTNFGSERGFGWCRRRRWWRRLFAGLSVKILVKCPLKHTLGVNVGLGGTDEGGGGAE